MKDLLYLKDEQIKDFIQLLFYAYRETFSDPKEILSKKLFGPAHLRSLNLIERHPGINLSELMFKLKITKQSLRENFDLSPNEYLLSRIIEGDKSDNIIGVEGIGPKRAQGLAKEHKTFETLLKAFPIKGRAKYIQNLNSSRDLLERNEKLINLKKYNEDAIVSGKYGEEPLDVLSKL